MKHVCRHGRHQGSAENSSRKIRECGSRAYIVFVTAFITYALEGYKVDAIRFLLKDDDSLESSIEECLDSIILKMNY